jgi:hypothetical protein
MAKKPEPAPELTAWSVYKIAKKAAWLGIVEAPDKQAAVAAQEFKTEVWRLYAVARRCPPAARSFQRIDDRLVAMPAHAAEAWIAGVGNGEFAVARRVMGRFGISSPTLPACDFSVACTVRRFQTRRSRWLFRLATLVRRRGPCR